MPKRTSRRPAPASGKHPWLIPVLLFVLVLSLLVTGFYAYQIWVDFTRLPTAG